MPSRTDGLALLAPDIKINDRSSSLESANTILEQKVTKDTKLESRGCSDGNACINKKSRFVF